MPAFDAASFDIVTVDVLPVFDVPVFDAPSADARDARDAGPLCSDLRLVSEARVEWPMVDCGSIGFPRATAVSGDNGPFQILITEFRHCRDRSPHLLTRRLGVDGSNLVFDAETVQGTAEGKGNIASSPEGFAVCSGSTLHSSSFLVAEELRPPCMPQARCAGLAYDGAGWGVGWQPGCGRSGELSRSRVDGGLREAPINTGVMTGVTSVAPSANGFGALAVISGSVSLFDWPRSAPEPRETRIEVEGLRNGLAALSAWPFVEDAWVVYTVEGAMLHVRVFTASGDILVDQRHDIELPSYDAVYLRASSSPAGAAVIVSYSWTGGRVDSATRLFVFGAEASLISEEVGIDLGDDLGVGGADVAMSGRSILVHRAALPGEVGASEVLLYECF